MTFSLQIDQKFAVEHGMTIVQTTTLAACFTLPIWSKSIAVDGQVWYQYSEEKMAEDFPLLFGCPKRFYKNAIELADLGFIEMMKVGRDKYLHFTAACSTWNRVTDQKRTESPKTDFSSPKLDENSPKLDSVPITNNELTNRIDNNNTPADGQLFEFEEKPKKRDGRKTKKPYISFEETEYYKNPELFCQRLAETGEFPQNTDFRHYYYAAIDWSMKGNKYTEWVSSVRIWIRNDKNKNKLPIVKTGYGDSVLSPEAIKYLEMGRL